MSMTMVMASLLALTLLAAPLTLLDTGSRNRTSEIHSFITIRPRLPRLPSRSSRFPVSPQKIIS